jgi:hypothetical protein
VIQPAGGDAVPLHGRTATCSSGTRSGRISLPISARGCDDQAQRPSQRPVRNHMKRFGILMGATLVLGAIAYALGHYMDRQGIRSEADAEVAAREKVEKRELETRPPARQ